MRGRQPPAEPGLPAPRPAGAVGAADVHPPAGTRGAGRGARADTLVGEPRMGGRGFRCRKSGSFGEPRRGRQDGSPWAGCGGLACGWPNTVPSGSVGGLGSLEWTRCRSDRLGALCRRQPSPAVRGECSGAEEPARDGRGRVTAAVAAPPAPPGPPRLLITPFTPAQVGPAQGERARDLQVGMAPTSPSRRGGLQAPRTGGRPRPTGRSSFPAQIQARVCVGGGGVEGRQPHPPGRGDRPPRTSAPCGEGTPLQPSRSGMVPTVRKGGAGVRA